MAIDFQRISGRAGDSMSRLFLVLVAFPMLIVGLEKSARAEEETIEWVSRDPRPDRVIPTGPLVSDELYAERSLRTRRTGMGVLGGWALVNLAVSCPSVRASEAERVVGFHEMNCMWNGVNLGLAGAGLATSLRPLEPEKAREAGQRLERLLLFNAGLDLGYVMTGMWLRERGARLDDRRLEGWGDSLLAQGGFLFAFDLGLYLSHLRVGRVARRKSEG